MLNCLLACKIALVSDKELVDALCRISVDFLKPLLDVCESVLVCHIVDDDDTVGSTVVRRRDGTESFLTCCVPDLKLDCLALELNCADLEVDANGRDV